MSQIKDPQNTVNDESESTSVGSKIIVSFESRNALYNEIDGRAAFLEELPN